MATWRYVVFFHCPVTGIYYEEHTNAPFKLLETYGFDLTLDEAQGYIGDLYEERDENGNGY